MGLVLTAPPAVEPVTVEEAKAHLRIDYEEEDTLLSSLITTSRLHIETALNLALITQKWSWHFNKWPRSSVVELPIRPVQSIEAIRINTEDGGEILLSPDEYVLESTIHSARLVSTNGTWPQPGIPRQGIEIAFLAGFGEAGQAVPSPIRQALLMLVSHWYENREPVVIGEVANRIPDMVSALLMPYRRVRL